MKKTIAILLVMTMALVGVFADDPTPAQTTQTTLEGGAIAALKITTTVLPISALSITQAKFTGTTLAAWNGQTSIDTAAVSSDPDAIIAYMNLIHNTKAGIAVYASATKMASADTNNTYKIGYTATCNGASIVAGATTTLEDDSVVTTKTTVITTTNSASADKLFIGSWGIAVAIDSTSFDNAPADSYAGTITFDFVAQA